MREQSITFNVLVMYWENWVGVLGGVGLTSLLVISHPTGALENHKRTGAKKGEGCETFARHLVPQL